MSFAVANVEKTVYQEANDETGGEVVEKPDMSDGRSDSND
jgi:hypothetical protein